MSKETIGQKVKKAREKAGLTQQQLAEATGYGKQHISNIECGRGNPSGRMKKALEAALGVKL